MSNVKKNNSNFPASEEEMKDDLLKLLELYKEIQKEAKIVDNTKKYDQESLDKMKTNLSSVLSSVKEISNKYQDNEYVKGLSDTIKQVDKILK